MPMNRIASRPAITASVVAAFFASGGLKAGHAGRDRLRAGQGDGAGGEGPQQEQDAERSRPCRCSWPGDRRARRLAARRGRRSGTTPIAIISRALTDEQVGRDAKMLPASRSPRRLPIVIRLMAPTPISDRSSNRAGNADMICSTADDVDTATVMHVVDEQGRRRDQATRPAEVPRETEYEPPPVG